MATTPRYIPPTDGYLALTSMRCLQARYLLTPSEEVNGLIIGVLAKAQEKYGVEIILPAVLSNHIHLLLWVENTEQLSKFQNYVNSNLAREIGRHHGWTGKFWEKRYDLVLVAPEDAAQISTFKYLLAHGCKENLVARPRDWPGVNAARALLSGRNLKGQWIDRTGLYNARRRAKTGAAVRPIEFVEELELELMRLPCWQHLSDAEYLERIRAMIRSIEEETEQRHRTEGSRPLGRRAVLRKNPHFRPENPKRSPSPRVIAATRQVKEEILEALKIFVRAYRSAAEKLRQGDRSARFPKGCFPPALPFVHASK